MEIFYSNFLKNTIPDNDSKYISIIETTIKGVDEFAVLKIEKFSDKYYFRITLSENFLTNNLVKELNSINNLLGLKYEYGKSLKKGNVFFKLLYIKEDL